MIMSTISFTESRGANLLLVLVAISEAISYKALRPEMSKLSIMCMYTRSRRYVSLILSKLSFTFVSNIDY